MLWWLILLLSAGPAQNRIGPYGQELPGRTPVRFTPQIVNPDHSVPTFSPDGREIWWAQQRNGAPHRQILSVRLEGGRWSAPEIAPFCANEDGDCPVISPDGQTLFFNSSRALTPDGRGRRERFWFVTRTATGWSAPRPVDDSVNGGPLHWQASVDSQGSLYFGSERAGALGKDDIFVAVKTESGYAAPRSMPPPINTKSHESTPFIGPSGDYILFTRTDFSPVPPPYPLGLLASFKGRDGGWSEPVRVALEGGRDRDAVCPFVTRDGRLLVFLVMSADEQAAYWVDASVIWNLRRSP